MKRIIIIFSLFLLVLITYSQDLNWSPYTTISSSSDGYGRPRVVLTSNNNPLIIWRKDSAPKVLRASKWNGTGFSAPYDILSPGILPSSWDGPEIASKGDTVYVVFTSTATSQSSIMMIKSFDGGYTFSDTIRVSENNSAHKFRMANIAVNSDGNPVVSYMQYLINWMEPKQMVNTSNDFGNTFNGQVEGSLMSPGEPCDCCKSSLVTSGDDIFLLYRNNENNIRNSYLSKSTDGGMNFTLASDLDDYNWILNSCPATTPRGVVLEDSLVIIKRSGASGNNEIVLNTVSMQDLNYSYNFNIDYVNGALQDHPEIANNKDTIIVVWKDNRHGMQNCYISYSTQGPNWINGSIAFTDSSTIGHKFDPDVAFANKDIHLVYLDYSQYKIVYVKASFGTINSFNNTKADAKNKVKIYDVLGRESKDKKNQILIYMHENGVVEKRVLVD